MYSKELSVLWTSVAIVVFGTIVFCTSFSIDAETVKFTIIKILPYSLVLGIMGYIVGKILDSSSAVRK